jgi:hypothetical protein
MKDEKVIVIDINLTRGLAALLALALLLAAFLGYLAWNQGAVAASGPQAPLDHARDRPLASSAGMRQYYLTMDWYEGDEALTACASGYHMASLWEILDPSNLKYNTDLGDTGDDSGQGPPSLSGGWVRTGYSSSGSSTKGIGNCNAWTSSDCSPDGPYACLTPWWAAGLEELHVWEFSSYNCCSHLRVWCVED